MENFEALIQSQLKAIRGRGGEYTILCPWHGERTPSLSVNVNKGVFLCHGCGEKGRSWKLAARLEGVSIREAAARYGGEGVVLNNFEEKSEAVRLPEPFVSLPSDGYFGRRAMAYLVGRGITREQMLRHRIGFCARGEYARRIIIPVVTQGKLRTFIARDFEGRAKKRVLYPPGSEGVMAIFGYDFYRSAKIIIITEGWADALAVERVIENEPIFKKHLGVVAINGSSLSDEKLLMMKKFRKFLLMLDKAANNEALKMKDELSIFNRPIAILKIEDKDPAVTSSERLVGLLRKGMIEIGL
jgi:DNA primase